VTLAERSCQVVATLRLAASVAVRIDNTVRETAAAATDAQ
jgi:hypothetical protein